MMRSTNFAIYISYYWFCHNIPTQMISDQYIRFVKFDILFHFYCCCSAALGRVCMKLVIVMGVTWTADVLSWIAEVLNWGNDGDYFWYATDLINALQGVLIFIVVGCQPQVNWTISLIQNVFFRANSSYFRCTELNPFLIYFFVRFRVPWNDCGAPKMVDAHWTQHTVNTIRVHRMVCHRWATQWPITHSTIRPARKFQWKRFVKCARGPKQNCTSREITPMIIML